MTARAATEVVAALIEAPGGVLLAQRAAHRQDAGLWEFPGGKIEPGEDAFAALERELDEELGLRVDAASRLLRIVHSKVERVLGLELWRVQAWRGVATACPSSHAALAIVPLDELHHWRMPAADVPLARALKIPRTLAITAALEAEAALVDEVAAALRAGHRWVQLRAPGASKTVREAVVRRAQALVDAAGGVLLVNAPPDEALAAGARAIHLSANALSQWAVSPGPRPEWLGASCHDARELELAAAVGVDYVLLGPVRPTPTHPGATTLGWDGFAALARLAPAACFALGGMVPRDLARARSFGAHGVAGIRGFGGGAFASA